MNEERLSAIALIHTHYDDVVDMDEAVDLFARLHARRLELDSVLLSWFENENSHDLKMKKVHIECSILFSFLL